MINMVLKYRRWCFGVTILLMPVGFFIAPLLPVKSLPPVAQTETLCSIDWNEPIDAVQNRNRLQLATADLKGLVEETEVEVGIQQFSMQQQATDMQQAILYLKCTNETKRIQAEKKLARWLLVNYPLAQYTIAPAPNAFTQLFARNQPHIEARMYPPADYSATLHTQNAFVELLPKLPVSYYKTGADMVQAKGYELMLNRNLMGQYGITDEAIKQAISRTLSSPLITSIKQLGDVIPVVWRGRSDDMETLLSTTVAGTNGSTYPLSTFFKPVMDMQPKYITADKAGVYHSLTWTKGSPDSLQTKVDNASRLQGWQVKWTGTYFEDKALISRVWLIFSLVVFLLYLILVIQYESMIQPLVVMLTIPLGVSGAMFILWATGGSLNVMAAVGFIVVLGLIVDDPILKIETLNRLEKKYRALGLPFNEDLLKRMIHEAGDICLKPLLMVSLTTSIALVPVLLIPGIGNDLQKPLALVIMGGLTIGTFFTTWFIPIAYWYSMRWKWRKTK